MTKRPRREKRVLFAIHDIGILDHAIALARQLRLGTAQAAWCWSRAGSRSADGTVTAPELGRRQVALDSTGRLERQWSAVVVQTPYDEHRASEWRENVGEADGLTYAGYGLIRLTNWDEGNYGLAFYRRCRHVLVSNTDEIGRYVAAGVEHRRLIHTGDPLLFEIIEGAARQRLSGETPVLLWMPHWTEDWFGNPGYSTWTETVFDVLDAARSEPAVTTIIRPHPFLRRSLESSDRVASPSLRAFRELLALPNTTLSAGPLVGDLLNSSAVLTDGISSIAYAAAAGRPLAVCRRSDSPLFNEEGEMIVAAADVVVGSGERRKWLHRHLSSPSSSRLEHLQEVVLSCFPLLARSPGEIFADRLTEVSRGKAAD